ncbi:MFS transporter [Chloroflexus sp.]|uniref:MFS transporter n=3 Tax=Chloroflexus sp. TaxID=1904827 RepID=UPI00404A1C0A
MLLKRLHAGRIYYGWIMLLTVSITEVISWGILYYAYSVFILPMSRDLAVDQLVVATGYAVALLTNGLAAPLVGWWLDRAGSRWLMTAGSFLGCGLLVVWSQITTPGQLYLVMAGIGLASAAVLYEPAFAIVATWFRRERGRALQILTFFGAWAGFVFIPLSGWLVDWLGWRSALIVLALILSLTIPPHALILRRRLADLGLEPDGISQSLYLNHPPEPSLQWRAVVARSRFWLISLAFAISSFATVAMTVHLIPYLISRGELLTFASAMAGLHGLMSLLGRLLISPLGERWPRWLVTGGLFGLQMIGLTILTLSTHPIAVLVYVALFGAGAGTQTIMRAALIAEQYGVANYGVISGLQNALLTVARTVAPVGAGVLVGWIGYDGMAWCLIGLLGLGVLALVGSGNVT